MECCGRRAIAQAQSRAICCKLRTVLVEREESDKQLHRNMRQETLHKRIIIHLRALANQELATAVSAARATTKVVAKLNLILRNL